MTTYNTGNPVPSADARDRYDNSQTFDDVINGTLTYYSNRIGNNILSLKGMKDLFNAAQFSRENEFASDQADREAAFQQFLDGTGWSSIGAYGAGVVITSHTQYVTHEGQPYSLKPSIPASLDAPYVTTGDWATEGGNFKLVGDNSLRQDLADPEGSTLLGFERASVTSQILNVEQMLSAQPATLWEFADLVTIKPTPGDSSTWDWSPALVAAAAENSSVDGLGATYRIGATTIPGTVRLFNISFKPALSVTGFEVLTIAGDGSQLDLAFDGDGKGITCVNVTGDGVTGRVRGSNLVGQEQATGGTQSIVRIQGADCSISVEGRDLVQGSSSNTSIPRILTTDLSGPGTGARNQVKVRGVNVQCGWVTAQPDPHCSELHLDGVNDNGIYHLSGVVTVGSFLIKNGKDEPFASTGKLSIEDFTVIDCDGFASVSDCDLTIGTYTVLSPDPTKSYQILAARPTNVSSSVKIGVLQGDINLAKNPTVGGIFQFSAGEISSLNVGQTNLKLKWPAGSTKILSAMANLRAMNLGQFNLSLTDLTGTLTSADKFDFRLPTAFTSPSNVGPVKFVSTSGDIRMTEVSQPNLRLAPFADVSTTFGPYILQEQTAAPRPNVFYASAVPTTGTYKRGDWLVIRAPSHGAPSAYKFIAHGAFPSGTWQLSEFIMGRGVSASRPAAGVYDTGLQYLDNTLSAAGKLITWNGSAWVDATGTVV